MDIENIGLSRMVGKTHYFITRYMWDGTLTGTKPVYIPNRF